MQSYSFSLKADQVITFKQIGDMGDEFIVEETGTLPEGMQRLAGGDGITPIILPDITSYVTEEVINGDPNYVIVKKKYSGNGFDESSAQTILSNNLEMKLEFYKISDNTPISVSNIGNYVSLKTLDGIKTVTSGENITMTGNDTIIINLKGIADSASLDKSEIGYNVTETIPTASQKYIPVGEDVFYYIESAGDGDEHNTFSGTSADTVLNVNNTVTKYGSVIYKRVIKEERDDISPEDNAQISFKITDSITGEIPTKPIYYVPAYVSSTGVVTVDPNDIGTVGEGGTFSIEKKAGTGSWSDSGRSDYYLKIYFSEPVLINASSGYTITEDLAHTHSSWGTLIGHEATAEALKRTSGSGEGIITDDWLNSNYQWTYHDMDTFVNTTKTNKVTAEKSVEIPQGAEFDAANTYFTYTLEEKRNGSVWTPLPNISYTIHSPYQDDGTVIEERANYITRNKAYTNEKGQLQLRKDEWVEINVPQIATLRLLEDNTGKHRLQIDDSGNLTDEALVQTNTNAPANLNVKEVNTGFTWDMDKTLSDGLTRGPDVVITRLAYYDNDYWHMGIRFAERGTVSPVTSYADDTVYMDDSVFYYNGGSNDFVGGATSDHRATITRYTSGLLKQQNTADSISSFAPDSNVTAIYAYDATNKANSCKGPIIWLNSNQVDATKPATVSKIDKNNTEYTLTKITDSQNRIVNVATLSDGAMGYVNLDYCITNTTRTQELNIPEYIIVERNVEGNITLTKQKVVGIATNACRTWDDKQNMSTCTITSLNIPKSVKKLAIMLYVRMVVTETMPKSKK